MAKIFKAASNFMANAFRINQGTTPHFEAASQTRRLRSFNPSRNHINRAIEASGETIIARSRWLYDNSPLYGSAVDEWVSAAVNDGIKPNPIIKNNKVARSKLLKLFWQWVDEADYDGALSFYGLQETICREAKIAGECFVRLHIVEKEHAFSVPLQLEIYPTEMLDVTYDAPAEIPGHYIRMGIEFNQENKRVAYHFWRWHPYDNRPNAHAAFNLKERVRIPAEHIIHIKEHGQAKQLRGTPKITRSLVKLFQLDAYDDAELDRKKTTALFTAFMVGRGEMPINLQEDDDEDLSDLPEMQPGAVVDLGDDRDIRFSTPAEVGGSYEPFQYRNQLNICAGLNMPYSVVTGDVTRGNFSNVRTAIIQFRRHVKQWRGNVMAFQFNRIIWQRFVEVAVLSNAIKLPFYEQNPLQWWQCESYAAPLEMIEPNKDIAAEKEEIRAGLKTRTMALNERGFDREDIDREIEEERIDAINRGLSFDTDMAAVASVEPMQNDEVETENNQNSDNHHNGFGGNLNEAT